MAHSSSQQVSSASSHEQSYPRPSSTGCAHLCLVVQEQVSVAGLEQSCAVWPPYSLRESQPVPPVQVLEEQLGRRQDAVAPLRPVLLRTLADVQQRLTFRVQAFIKARSLVLIYRQLVCCRAAAQYCFGLLHM